MSRINPKRKELVRQASVFALVALAVLAAYLGYQNYKIRNDLHPDVLVFAGDSSVTTIPSGLTEFLKESADNYPDDTGTKYTAFYSIQQVINDTYAIVYTGGGVHFDEYAALKTGNKWTLIKADESKVNEVTGDYVRFNCSTVNKYRISNDLEKYCVDNTSPNSPILKNKNP